MLIFDIKLADDLPKTRLLLNDQELFLSITAIDVLSPEIKSLSMGDKKPFHLIQNSKKFSKHGRFMKLEGLDFVIGKMKLKEMQLGKITRFRNLYLELDKKLQKIPHTEKKITGYYKSTLIHPHVSKTRDEKIAAFIKKTYTGTKFHLTPGKDLLPYGH